MRHAALAFTMLACAALPARAADVTPPAAAALSAGSATRRSVEIRWDAPGDDGAVGTAASYDLRYTPIGPIDTAAKFAAAPAAAGLPVPAAAGTPQSFALTGLLAATTYYLALRSADEAANLSPLSNSLQVLTLTAAPPAPVAGIRGTRDEGTGAFTLSWSALSLYSDGSALDQDFTGYELRRSTSLTGVFAPVASLSSTTLSYTDPGSLTAAALYRIHSADALGGFSTARTALSNDADTRVIFTSPDGAARLEVPAAVQGPLFAAGNPLGEDVRCEWTRRPAEESGPVFLSYDLSVVQADLGAGDLIFPQPGAELYLTPPAGADWSRLAVFGDNGVDYTKLGGLRSGDSLVITVTRPGRYRLQEAARASAFQVTRVVPSKVFTPNGDGINDAIAIHFENPGRDTVSGDVFDVTGSRVGSLKLGPSGDSLSWDGKDGSGQGARPGVYIYQLRGGGSSASGTVVLVR
ncbi:MAG: hypothetical protein A2X36_08150 [Elusimicrobia bacterium GWA2_69_24]|nr:MAG: hypothetical protein A2X36_08150 [Elusimicrobia bacterium GWA2_69_24]HBL16902.1 hypothetical protein [Elusimicrobiota bacterium]